MSERLAATESRTQSLERKVHDALRPIRGQGGFICVTAAGIVAAVGTVPGLTIFLLGGALLAGVGIFLQVRLDPKYADLAQQAREERMRAEQTARALNDVLASILRRIAMHCRLDVPHARISIYCHVGSEFIMLARESKSTALRTSGRTAYPDSMGVIGEAWDVGECFVGRWPEERADWEDWQVRRYGMPIEVARSLRMQARSVVALRLTHAANHVGVIVMESTQARGVMKRHIKEARESLLLDSATEMLTTAQPHFPAVAEYVKRQSETPAERAEK